MRGAHTSYRYGEWQVADKSARLEPTATVDERGLTSEGRRGARGGALVGAV